MVGYYGQVPLPDLQFFMIHDIDGAMCSWLEQDGPTIQDYVLGQYVTNDPAGIRTHPYSTSSCVSCLFPRRLAFAQVAVIKSGRQTL